METWKIRFKIKIKSNKIRKFYLSIVYRKTNYIFRLFSVTVRTVEGAELEIKFNNN